ncbi:hypothetical protein G3I01_16680 [Gramella sp. MT6]|uniref:hypothetical protein n=1 Tax=Gramella sp. MT6 TaxID=2705471 RepID=UPI001C5D252A|nr:hypothetical protein [Gramella sp. MT6]QYA27060.1 hypothetical protein G3I01_16680 [Gramella sp. MT6]
MDENLFYFVVGASVIIVAGIWIKLLMDNTRQEKLIKRYIADLSILKKNRSNRVH